jgi:hypothetical protein
MRRLCWFSLRLTTLFMFFLCFCGCGDGLPRRVHVSGRVLIDGKPLEQGAVEVHPIGQRLAYGSLGTGGKFVLSTFSEGDGCIPGKHPVAIIAYEGIGSDKIHWFAPKKYTKPKTSGLEIDVSHARDDVEISLTWGGGKPYIENVTADQ